MTEELNPKTLDLIGVLSGRDYPTLDVPVYFNEALGFEIHQIQKELESAEKRGDTKKIKSLDEKLASKVKQAESEKYVVGMRSIPESVRRSVIAKVEEQFPQKTDLLGRAENNPKADEEFTKRMWQAYIKTVTSPEGASKAVDEADINALYANAPITVHEQITRGIQELQTGAKSGFEYAAKEVDFLSQASPEG